MISGPVQSGLNFSVHFKEAVRYLYDAVCLYMVCVCVGQIWRAEDHLVKFALSLSLCVGCRDRTQIPRLAQQFAFALC